MSLQKASARVVQITFVVVAIAVATVSCRAGSTDDDTQVPGETAIPATLTSPVVELTRPSAIPSATPGTALGVKPGATPNATPPPMIATTTPTPLPVDRHASNLVGMLESICSGDHGAGRAAIGTVPMPTPTPPTDEREANARRLSDYFTGVSLVVESLGWYSEEFAVVRQVATTDQQRADALFSQGRRFEQLCAAAVSRPIPGGAADFAESLSSFFTNHKKRLQADAGALGTGGGLPATVFELTGLIRALEFYATQNDVALNTLPSPSTLVADQMKIEISVPPAWIPVRNDAMVVLVAFNELQMLSVNGLGPQSWDLGTAVRFRSFSGDLLADAAEAPSVLPVLMMRLGSETGRSEMTISGNRWYAGEFTDSRSRWITFAAISAVDGGSYLVELGCPLSERTACLALFDLFVTTVEFN